MTQGITTGETRPASGEMSARSFWARFAARPHAGLWADLVILVVCILAWSFAGIFMYEKFTSGLDLAIFDQGIGNLAHFRAPTAPIKSVGMNLWGDHFHPIIVLAVPFLWLWPNPMTLIILQAACIGVGAVILRRVAAAHLGYWLSFLIGIALVFSLGVEAACVFDFHEVALGFPILAGAMALLLRKRPWGATWLFLACLLIKEDAPILVFGFGIAMVFFRYIRQAVTLLIAAPVWYLLATKVFIPALSPNHTWAYAGAVTLRWSVIWTHLGESVWGRDKLLEVAIILALGAGALCVRSPLAIPVALNLLSRAVSRNPNYWGFRYHYNLLPSLILAFATVEVLIRIGKPSVLLKRLVAACLGIMIVVNLFIAPIHAALGWGSFERAREARLAVAAVPKGAPVACDVYLTSHLTTSHPIVQQLRPPAFVDDLGHPVLPNADWVILDSKTISYPTSPGWVAKLADRLTSQGWQRVAVYGEFSVYRR